MMGMERAELAPLSHDVAEVPSLSLERFAPGLGAGPALVQGLRLRTTRAGFERLCAFTHAPDYFAHLGLSIVPHASLLEKVWTDLERDGAVQPELHV